MGLLNLLASQAFVATALCLLCSYNGAEAIAEGAGGEREFANARANQFLEKLSWFSTTASGTQAPVSEIDSFLEDFLETFTKPTFEPNKELLTAFVEQSPVIANLVRLSEKVESTDVHLKQVDGSLEKVLALYSVDNGVEVAAKTMFEVNPELASLWVSKTLGTFATRLCCNERSSLRLSSLLRPASELQDLGSIGAYFGSSYIDAEEDKAYKSAANAQIREAVSTIYVANHESLLGHSRGVNLSEPKRRKKRVAVVSATWHKSHPVHRNFAELVGALRGGGVGEAFHVTLVAVVSGNTGAMDEFDLSAFDSVRQCCGSDPAGKTVAADLDWIAGQEFDLIFFPEIGMHAHSVLLANTRLARVQVTGYGHSVSTHGAEVDYFVAGEDAEDIKNVASHYSERVVLVPGIGLRTGLAGLPMERPALYNDVLKLEVTTEGVSRRRITFRKQASDDDRLIINCPWSAHKTTRRHLDVLSRIAGRSSRRLVYRFFPNLPLASLEFRVFSRDIGIFFSAIENAEYMVIPRVSQADYLRIMRQGDLTLDSAHWGSCNSAVDSLAVGIPVVALEGKLWHSRVAAAILRRLSLPELVAESETEFEDRVLALTDNETYRRAVTEALLLAELSDDVLSGTDRHWLRTTFHYLIEHHGGDETIMPIRMRSMYRNGAVRKATVQKMSDALIRGMKALVPPASRVVLVSGGDELDIRAAIKHVAIAELIRSVGGVITQFSVAKRCSKLLLDAGTVLVVIGMEGVLDLPLDQGAKIVVLFAPGDDSGVLESAAKRVAAAWDAGSELDLALVARDQIGLAALQGHFPRARITSLPDPTMALAGTVAPHKIRTPPASLLFRSRSDYHVRARVANRKWNRRRVWHLPTVLEGEGVYVDEERQEHKGTSELMKGVISRSRWTSFGFQNEKAESIFRELSRGDRALLMLELAVADLSRAKVVATDSVTVSSLCLMLGIDHVAVTGSDAQSTPSSTTETTMRAYLGSWRTFLKGERHDLSQRQQLASRGFAVAQDWDSVEIE